MFEEMSQGQPGKKHMSVPVQNMQDFITKT